jgi:hypothetical protein
MEGAFSTFLDWVSGKPNPILMDEVRSKAGVALQRVAPGFIQNANAALARKVIEAYVSSLPTIRWSSITVDEIASSPEFLRIVRQATPLAPKPVVPIPAPPPARPMPPGQPSAPPSGVPVTQQFGPWTPDQYEVFVQTGQLPSYATDPQPPAEKLWGEKIFGRRLTQNEQYAVAAGGGLLALGLVIALTRRK